MGTGAAFTRGVVAALPHRLRTAPTDNGVAFRCACARWDRMAHPLDRVREEHGVEHRLTGSRHPWANGRADRMNRTVREAAVEAFHRILESLAGHLQAFLSAYSSAKHPEAPSWPTPFQAARGAWKADPSPFKTDPHHLIPGPHTWAV